jgi:hypothetical protein
VYVALICLHGVNSLRILSTRRKALTAAAALPFVHRPVALAADTATDTATAPLGLSAAIERTLRCDDQNRPPVRCVQQVFQGIDAPDVYYPEWFEGRWRASSTLVQVLAPAGPEVFSPGRNGSLALANARAGIGDALQYDVRWVALRSGQRVVDREFNLASITKASMGGKAVQDIQSEGPDKCLIYIQPSAAPGSPMFRADLRVIGRRAAVAYSPGGALRAGFEGGGSPHVGWEACIPLGVGARLACSEACKLKRACWNELDAALKQTCPKPTDPLAPARSSHLLNRRTDPLDASLRHFECAETVRQTVVLVPGERAGPGATRPPMVKEVETICTYELDPAGNRMRGLQRTATFLAADASYTSGASFAEQQAVQLARGPGGRQVAIDMRTYELLYERV